jgi:L-fuconolactonase
MPGAEAARAGCRVDAHHHLWDLAARPQPWTAGEPVLARSFPFDELRVHLDRHGIGLTVVVQTVAVAGETPELLALAAGETRIAGVVGWVDLESPGVADALGALRDAPGGDRLVGVRHLVQDEPDPAWLTRPTVRSSLAAVASAGLVYDLLVRPPQMEAAIDTVTAVPEVSFVLDHAGKPPLATGELEPWRAQIRRLGRLPNVAVKLSGLVSEADRDHWRVGDIRAFGEVVLDAFGPERTMFGSDWPACLPAADYDRVVEVAEACCAGLDRAETAMVFGGTATAWYRLAPENGDATLSGTGPATPTRAGVRP